MRRFTPRLAAVRLAVALTLLATTATVLHAQDVPRPVLPGAPGEPSRTLQEEDGSAPASGSYSKADVQFMQHMIHHHAQALEMTALVPDRSERTDIRRLARRIEVAQAEEIDLMQRWLEERGEIVPPAVPASDDTHHHSDHHAHHMPHPAGDHASMPGMLSAEQLERLAAASGDEFDRLFLELMIFHHEGAVAMVEELFASGGAAQDTAVFRFASHVESDQRIEVDRMRAMLRQSPHHGTE